MNFALIGVGGYIAPRHLKAIKETDDILLAAIDRNDSVGIIDSYFPDAFFTTEFETFDSHIYQLNSSDSADKIDYVSICTPNYLHEAHIKFALRNNAHAICEKPLVLTPEQVNDIEEMEKSCGKRVYSILQLRLHDSIVELKKRIDSELKQNPDKVYELDLTYMTSRGNWYHKSWKGDTYKSGGLATNIGVHFFDMLSFLFGDVKENIIHIKNDSVVSGQLRLKNAEVKWLLSVDYDLIPDHIKKTGQRTYRSITMGNEEIEFSSGFTDLHTKSYQEILAGRGFSAKEALNSITIVDEIRKCDPIGLKGDYHPYLKEIS